jgi:hypothetical protein
VPADSPAHRSPQSPSLSEGRLLRCPHCELLRDPLDSHQFKRFQRVDKYALDLNVVYQCVKNKDSGEGCGHIFSPGDQRVLMAFLQGDLVPALVSNGSNGEVISK